MILKNNGVPASDGYTMPAEYAPHDGCILIWPQRPGSWNYGAAAAQNAFLNVIKAIAKSEKVFLGVWRESLPSALEKVFSGSFSTDEEKKTYRYKSPTHARDERQKAENLWRENTEIFEAETDDAWARDVAPTFVKNRATGDVRGVNWKFNAWGGEVDGLYADWEKDDRFATFFTEKYGYPCYDASPFVLEGGAVHSDGEGTAMVTESCLLSKGRNPALTKAQIEEKLKQYLGVQKVLWLPRGIYNDETDEHVDNVCAFIRPAEVVLAWTDDESDPQYPLSRADYEYLSAQRDARGRKITVHKLPIPDIPVRITQRDLDGYEFEEGEDEREVGERLAASYVNFYFSNGGVVLPVFGGENEESDERAVKIMQALLPDREIYPVYARDILTGGGNIHCITQQIPRAESKKK